MIFASSPRPSQSTVKLTGRLRKRRYEVIINGKSVFLPSSRFAAFLDLVVACLRTSNGFSQIPSNASGGVANQEETRLVIHRLRNDMRAVFGRGPVDALVLSAGVATRYRLNVSRSDIDADDSFFDLIPGVDVDKPTFDQIKNWFATGGSICNAHEMGERSSSTII